ncbi:MAG TPA: hypothetical protein VFE18_05205 [Phenylobacterium sp.]|jgi:hypothetical protein|uniref:hypothetical protein n=1 Tax=Phenylobacterium sp. TaxID=1871053 RepID=UPI002D657134|nr:hypothetical protein [Phenylobacterium sp.]HZZ67551.1 hypothetical protein [Phenylobacterium sp.]
MQQQADGDKRGRRRVTGERGLDIVLGGSAILISVISLIVAIHQGQIMDKMAQADTWPYLDFVASNLDDTGHENVSLTILNSGVGPAKIESIELTYDGVPLRDGGDLLRRCCVPKGVVQYHAATVADRVLPPKEPLVLFAERPETMTPDQRAKLDAARASIQARICYCSALDKCWVRDTTHRKAEDIASCPIPKVAYGETSAGAPKL